MTHLAVVGATIACGRVRAIDADAARAAEGVLVVLTHEDLPRIAAEPHLLPSLVRGAAPGESFVPMQDDRVHHAGQPVALVVAEEHEQAQYAASLVRVSYETAPSVTTIERGRDQAYEADRLFGGLLPGRSERGDVGAGLARADVRVEAGYRMAANHHNPLEAPSTVAVREGGRLTLHESTQGVRATQQTVAQLLGLPIAHVRVLTHFVERSPLSVADPASVAVADGRLTSAERPTAGDTYRELLARNHMSDAEALGTWRPPPLEGTVGGNLEQSSPASSGRRHETGRSVSVDDVAVLPDDRVEAG